MCFTYFVLSACSLVNFVKPISSAQVRGIFFQRQNGLDRRGGVSYLAEDGTRLRSIIAVESYLIRSGLKDELPGCLALFNFSADAADGDDQLSTRSTPCKQAEAPKMDKCDARPPTRGKRSRASSPPPPQDSSPVPALSSPPHTAEAKADSAASVQGPGAASAAGGRRIAGREPAVLDAAPNNGAAGGGEVCPARHRCPRRRRTAEMSSPAAHPIQGAEARALKCTTRWRAASHPARARSV